jgi:ParB/RepB/Spo0J family partition protein
MTNALKNSIARLGNKLEDFKKGATPLDLPLNALVPYRNQARTTIPENELRELADSIKDIGVIQPLLVRPIGEGKFEIIAGERRFRASMIAGLSKVPVLSKPVDDELAEKMHLAENIHRENLSTLDLARRVQHELDEAGGNLEAVAKRHSKSKTWVSRLSSIARGGDSMMDLVEEGVTADQKVLAAVSSLERNAPERAKVLTEHLKAAPESKKRVITEQFMKDERAVAAKAKLGKAPPAGAAKSDGKRKPTVEKEPAWRSKAGVARDLSEALIVVELSPVSSFAAEFSELSKKFGMAQLVVSLRHPDKGYAIVQFGNTDGHRRVYRADELRLLSVF